MSTTKEWANQSTSGKAFKKEEMVVGPLGLGDKRNDNKVDVDTFL